MFAAVSAGSIQPPLLEGGQRAPGSRARGDLAEEHLLIAQAAQVDQAVAVGERSGLATAKTKRWGVRCGPFDPR